jgi:hypothetical protein
VGVESSDLTQIASVDFTPMSEIGMLRQLWGVSMGVAALFIISSLGLLTVPPKPTFQPQRRRAVRTKGTGGRQS